MAARLALLSGAVLLVALAPGAEAAAVRFLPMAPEPMAVGTARDLLVPVEVACTAGDNGEFDPYLRVTVQRTGGLEAYAEEVALEAGPCQPGTATIVQVPVRLEAREDTYGDRLVALPMAASAGGQEATGVLQVELEFHPGLDVQVGAPEALADGAVAWQLRVRNTGDSPVTVHFGLVDTGPLQGVPILPAPVTVEPRKAVDARMAHGLRGDAETVSVHAYPRSLRDPAVAGEPVLLSFEAPAAEPASLGLPAPSVAFALAALGAAALRRR